MGVRAKNCTYLLQVVELWYCISGAIAQKLRTLSNITSTARIESKFYIEALFGNPS